MPRVAEPKILHAECVEAMNAMAENSIDAIVTDPPYGLEFMGKDWDKLDGGLPQESVWKGRRGKGGGGFADKPTATFQGDARGAVYGGNRPRFQRCTKCNKRKFSGSPCTCAEPEWVYEVNDGAPSGMIRQQRWHEQWARAALRVLKPGGHLLAFGGTRTYHRLACAIEDAGFDIRDTVAWLYASGFPKSHNVSKAIDRAAGEDRASDYEPNGLNRTHGEGWGGGRTTADDPPVTDDAIAWDGWGTALKPAHEPIVVARKPISEANIAANVLKWGTGAINVDGCRISGVPWKGGPTTGFAKDKFFTRGDRQEYESEPHGLGRWPANVMFDTGAAAMFDGANLGEPSRFFFVAKPSTAERQGEDLPLLGLKKQPIVHPTMKPVDLMRTLVRLVTPRGGVVLDPFTGSGTTGIACGREGFAFVGIERDEAYCELARQRIGIA